MIAYRVQRATFQLHEQPEGVPKYLYFTIHPFFFTGYGDTTIQVNLRSLSLQFAAVRSMGILLRQRAYCPLYTSLDFGEALKRLITLATSSSAIQVWSSASTNGF